MSPLLSKDGTILTDLYTLLPDDQPVPAEGRSVLVPLSRLTEIGRYSGIGLSLPNTTDVLKLPSSVLQLPLLALDFPSFGDGRAYSQARWLSGRLGYRGELRARGQAVVLDQLEMLRSCGFSQFELRGDQNLQACADKLAHPTAVSRRRFPSLA